MCVCVFLCVCVCVALWLLCPNIRPLALLPLQSFSHSLSLRLSHPPRSRERESAHIPGLDIRDVGAKAGSGAQTLGLFSSLLQAQHAFSLCCCSIAPAACSLSLSHRFHSAELPLPTSCRECVRVSVCQCCGCVCCLTVRVSLWICRVTNLGLDGTGPA
jgi:hypothetical protein